MKPLAGLLHTKWTANELFEVEHVYTIVAERTKANGEVSYAMSKAYIDTGIIVGFIVISESELKTLFIRTEDKLL